MNRLHCFAAGMISTAAAAAMAGIHIQPAMFVLGFTAAVSLAAACLFSRRMRRSAARWIASADPASSGVTARARRVSPGDAVPPPPQTPRERELTSALLNLGARKAPAAAAARYAIANSSPAADIPELLRIALRAPQVAA